MSFKRFGTKMIVLALAAILLMSLPLAAGAQMANGLVTPKNAETVKGTLAVTGYASDLNFSKWQLDLLPAGDPNAAVFLALGEKAGDFNYSLDTTGLPNGEHALRLRVVKNDGNYDEYANKFTIANGAAPAASSVAKPAPKQDVVATAISAGQFNTLVAAVKAAGLVGALQGEGPFTVFAPTDAAFAKLPAGTVESLLKDPKALANILLYHVISGEVKAAAVKDGLTAKTLQGSPVTFSVKDGKPMIDGANIIATDVMASNGVIHVIDSVILPPAPAAVAPATKGNGIIAPKDGASVAGTVAIKGSASDPSFSKWQLDLLPGGDPNNAVFLAVGQNPGDLSYALDTVGLPNGEHALRLRVVRNDGNYDEYITKFVIANK